jgi:hypothetical protein
MVAGADVAGVVTGDVVQSRCTAGVSGLAGASTLTNVKVGGRPFAANQARNTVIEVRGVARVILNEQIRSANSITVNAIHVQLLSGAVGDVILPQAHCAVTASQTPAVPESPLALLLPLLTMVALTGAVVVAWRLDTVVVGRSAG